MHRLRAALRCDLLAVVSNLEARSVLNFPLRPYSSLSSLSSRPPPPPRPRGERFDCETHQKQRKEGAHSLISDVFDEGRDKWG